MDEVKRETQRNQLDMSSSEKNFEYSLLIFDNGDNFVSCDENNIQNMRVGGSHPPTLNWREDKKNQSLLKNSNVTCYW